MFVIVIGRAGASVGAAARAVRGAPSGLGHKQTRLYCDATLIG